VVTGGNTHILVVGGAGYIGSVVVEHLLKANYRVTVLDNLSRGHREAVLPGADLVEIDLADTDALANCFADGRFDAVMHFSASSLVGESVHQPLPYYRNNVANGANLLHSMVEHDVKRIVFSSTAALFGNAEKQPICEDDAKAPTNPYGRTKLAFEHLLEDCDTAYALRSVCLRYFNAAGATELCGEHHHPETHLIPLVLAAAAGTSGPITVFGSDYPTRDGTCIRDYIHVSDLADAHLLALQHLLDGGESQKFNLGNGQGFTVNEVIAAAQRVTGKPVPRQAGPRRAGDPPTLIASSQKIQSQLGWKPRFTDLDAIIQSAWNWMQKHPAGYSQ
jgi:UDP-glucose 4-epimerase